jgi:hypothetical protein
MIEEVMEEIARWEAKSVLEKGSRHHNFNSVGGGNVFILCRSPLEYGAAGEKVVLDELEELTLINGRGLEHLWVRGIHGEEDESSSEERIAGAEKEEDGGDWNEIRVRP